MLKLKVTIPAKLLFSDAVSHPKWKNDSKPGISGREWFDWVEVNWEKGDGSSFYTVPAKLLLWGNVIFSNTTTILLACIRSLKSSTEMKIHKCMFFARGDTLCNDATELSIVEFIKWNNDSNEESLVLYGLTGSK